MTTLCELYFPSNIVKTPLHYRHILSNFITLYLTYLQLLLEILPGMTSAVRYQALMAVFLSGVVIYPSQQLIYIMV